MLKTKREDTRSLNLDPAARRRLIFRIQFRVEAEMRSRRIYGSDDLEQATGGPMLGTISTVDQSDMAPPRPAAEGQ